MRNLWRILWIGLAVLVLGAVVAGFLANEPRPFGKTGPAAEALADKMLAAVNKTAWDTTARVIIDFDGRQQHTWWKATDTVRVAWGRKSVILHTETITGQAFLDSDLVVGDEADEMVQKAWSHFCNDAFWVAAPFKIRDPGTERAIVTTEDGQEALLVTYTSGGVTPGDAYLWHLDESGLPTSYQMWVSIIPIGGVSASWEGWKTLSTGAKVATQHKIGPVMLEVKVEE